MDAAGTSVSVAAKLLPFPSLMGRRGGKRGNSSWNQVESRMERDFCNGCTASSRQPCREEFRVLKTRLASPSP